MKDSSSNLRMIIDIYCKYPKPSTKIVRTPLDIILLKNKGTSLSMQHTLLNLLISSSQVCRRWRIYTMNITICIIGPMTSSRIVRRKGMKSVSRRNFWCLSRIVINGSKTTFGDIMIDTFNNTLFHKTSLVEVIISNDVMWWLQHQEALQTAMTVLEL